MRDATLEARLTGKVVIHVEGIEVAREVGHAPNVGFADSARQSGLFPYGEVLARLILGHAVLLLSSRSTASTASVASVLGSWATQARAVNEHPILRVDEHPTM
jgi:hypothetical protein